MNVAIVIAGGVGSRMGQQIPKQFINVRDKPVLIYTLEAFQAHPQVEAIEVVCIDGWEDILKAYAKQFGISKLKWVVKGGKTGQESIRNGVYGLEGILSNDDIAIIHDGVRPMLDSDVITDVIRVCKNMATLLQACLITNKYLLLIKTMNQLQTNLFRERLFVVFLLRKHIATVIYWIPIRRLLLRVLVFTVRITPIR